MESIGKELDLDGNTVHQGLAVYGNKGSTDQHAYIQQLRDGVNNFFACFIEVRKGREGKSIEVDPGTTTADYLQGFFPGTRKALHPAGRKSLTVSIPEVNAYHQPGVEAGKKAAGVFLETLSSVRNSLTADLRTASQIAAGISADPEDVYHCLNHLAANGQAVATLGASPAQDTFSL